MFFERGIKLSDSLVMQKSPLRFALMSLFFLSVSSLGGSPNPYASPLDPLPAPDVPFPFADGGGGGSGACV